MFSKQLIKSSKKKKNFYENYTWIIFLLMWILPIFDIRFGILGLVSMSMAVILSLFSKGKPHCAYFCPRGGGLQKILTRFSMGYKTPKFITNKITRYGFTLLLTVKVVSGIVKSQNIYQLGSAMYTGFVATSILAITMGILMKPRVYCGELCHAGNIAGLINQIKTKNK
jgi:hypothetical protein